MSWKCSLTYWHLGPFDFHRYLHAAQPWNEKRVVFWEIGVGQWSFQVWPWTMSYERNPWAGEWAMARAQRIRDAVKERDFAEFDALQNEVRALSERTR